MIKVREFIKPYKSSGATAAKVWAENTAVNLQQADQAASFAATTDKSHQKLTFFSDHVTDEVFWLL